MWHWWHVMLKYTVDDHSDAASHVIYILQYSVYEASPDSEHMELFTWGEAINY